MTAKTSRLNLSEFMTTVIPSHGQVKLLAAVKIYPQKARVVFVASFVTTEPLSPIKAQSVRGTRGHFPIPKFNGE